MKQHFNTAADVVRLQSEVWMRSGPLTETNSSCQTQDPPAPRAPGSPASLQCACPSRGQLQRGKFKNAIRFKCNTAKYSTEGRTGSIILQYHKNRYVFLVIYYAFFLAMVCFSFSLFCKEIFYFMIAVLLIGLAFSLSRWGTGICFNLASLRREKYYFISGTVRYILHLIYFFERFSETNVTIKGDVETVKMDTIHNKDILNNNHNYFLKNISWLY